MENSESSNPQAPATRPKGGFIRPEAVVMNFGVSRGMKIADLGCGSGYFTILLAQLTGPEGRVWAVDVLNEALEAVRSRAKLMGIGNIEYVRGNLEKTESSQIADNQMDISLLANILFQSQKKQEIIKEAVRILKPKGKLIIIDWNKNANFGHTEKGWEFTPAEIQKMIEELALPVKFLKNFDSGQYHWGLMFEKK